MDLRKLQLLALALFLTPVASGQEVSPADQQSTVRPSAQPAPSASPAPEGPEQGLEARNQWKQLAPEQREQFRKNFHRWQQMPPEAREALRLVEQNRRERQIAEADQAISDSKLQLDEAQQKAFRRRFLEESRKIEKALRQEMELKRKAQIKALGETLKQELTTPPEPSQRTN